MISSWDNVTAFRLKRHHLLERVSEEELVRVAQDLCGIQAQQFLGAQLALRARIKDFEGEALIRTLWESKALVKTYGMRGTLHLLASSNLPLFIEAIMKPRTIRLEKWLNKYGVQKSNVATMTKAIMKALSTGPKKRNELTQYISGSGSEVRQMIEHQWGGYMKHVCYQGLVCFGPQEGQNVTFVDIASWLGKLQSVSKENAENEVLKRYLQTYGPATPQDYAHWSGLQLKTINPIWDRLSDELAPVTIEDNQTWILRKDEESLRKAKIDHSSSIRLLPSFDVYLLGHRNKNFLIEPAYYKQVFRAQAYITPTILIDGRIEGIWAYKRRAKRVDVTIKPFETFSLKIKQEIKNEVVDLERFFQLPVQTLFEK